MSLVDAAAKLYGQRWRPASSEDRNPTPDLALRTLLEEQRWKPASSEDRNWNGQYQKPTSNSAALEARF